MEYVFEEPLFRITDTSDETIANLYATWLMTKAEHHNRGFTLPKDYKKNGRQWSAFRKLAEFLNGSEVEPRFYFMAQLEALKNPFPVHFVSDRAIANYEKYHKKMHKPKDFMSDMKRSLKYVIEYCEKQNISFDKYLHHMNGKTNVALVHLQTGLLSPSVLILHPNLNEWLQDMDSDYKEEVADIIKKASYDIGVHIDDVRKVKEMLNV